MSDKRRVLILTADAGFGHRSAATALAAAFQDSHAADCAVDVVNPLDNERTPAFLRESQSDYDRLARETPELYKFGYDISDSALPTRLVENALRTLLYRSLRDTVREYRPDVIVSTYPLYQAPLGAVFAVTKTFVPLVCVVTDLATVHQLWFSSDADLTVVPTDLVRDLAIGADLSPRKVEVIGIPVHPRIARETRDRAELRAALGWEPDLVTILAVGSKRVASRLVELLDLLNHAGFPIQLAVAAGGDDVLYAELGGMEWHVPIHLYNFVNNMPTLMRAADILVGKAGGLVVTEALASGLPILLSDYLPGQEEGNAEFVVRGGAGELAKEPFSALRSVSHWLQDGGRLLRERSEAARRLGRPFAARDIAERAWELALRGPERREASLIGGLPQLLDLLERFQVPLEEK